MDLITRHFDQKLSRPELEELGEQILDEPPVVNLTRTNISVLSALNLLALQAGFELSFAPPTIKLIPKANTVSPAEPAIELVTRIYKVSPTLFATGPYRQSPPLEFSPDGSLIGASFAVGSTGIANAETGEIMATISHPPGVESVQFSPDGKIVTRFSPDGSATDVWDAETGQRVSGNPGQLWGATRSDLLAIWGFKISGDGQSGSYFPAIGELIIRSSPADQALFDALLAEATGKSASSASITISTKLFSLPHKLAGGSDRIVNPDEWQQIVRDWRQQDGVDLLTAPSVSTHIGQEAITEIVTTRFVEVNQEPGEDLGKVTASGLSGLELPFTTTALGEQILINGRIDQSFDEKLLASEMLEEFGGSDPDSPMVHFVTELEAPLYPGQVALFECESHEPERKVVAAVSVTWGSTASPQSSPEPSPASGSKN